MSAPVDASTTWILAFPAPRLLFTRPRMVYVVLALSVTASYAKPAKAALPLKTRMDRDPLGAVVMPSQITPALPVQRVADAYSGAMHVFQPLGNVPVTCGLASFQELLTVVTPIAPPV